MKKIKLATALNPVAARLIERYQITDEKLAGAKGEAGKWTKAQYEDYLQTDHWRLMRGKAILHYGRKCYLCGAAGNDVEIHVHHNDYSRLGGELLSDLIPLCDGCHEKYHER